MDESGRVWFISGSLLHSIRAGQHEEFPFPAGHGRRLQAARALVPLKNGALLAQRRRTSWPDSSRPRASAFSRLTGERGALQSIGALKDGAVCVQTSVPAGTNQSYRLEISSDGSHFEPFSDAPAPGRFGGELTVLFAAQNGDLWLSGERGHRLVPR